MGIINGIIWYVLGMHWAMDLGYVVMGIVAEIVAGAKGYRNIKWNIASFSLFCLGPAGVFLAYFADPAAWAETMLNNGTSQEYIDCFCPCRNVAGYPFGNYRTGNYQRPCRKEIAQKAV